jgi:hypothetical protein
VSQPPTLTLHVHLDGAPSYEVGDEIWQVGLADAIGDEADAIAGSAGAELLQSPTTECRDQLRDRVIAEMTAALTEPGDTYTAPDGVSYSLTARPDRRIL